MPHELEGLISVSDGDGGIDREARHHELAQLELVPLLMVDRELLEDGEYIPRRLVELAEGIPDDARGELIGALLDHGDEFGEGPGVELVRSVRELGKIEVPRQREEPLDPAHRQEFRAELIVIVEKIEVGIELGDADAHLVHLLRFGEGTLGRDRDLGDLEIVLVGILVENALFVEYRPEPLESGLEELEALLELDEIYPIQAFAFRLEAFLDAMRESLRIFHECRVWSKMRYKASMRNG